MEQRDYLMRQIEEMARVLGKILAGLLGLKTEGEVTEGIETARQTLKSELGLDTDEIMQVPPSDLIPFLKEKKQFNDLLIEQLANIFFYMSGAPFHNNKIPPNTGLAGRSLLMYEYLDRSSKTFSFERQEKVRALTAVLKGM